MNSTPALDFSPQRYARIGGAIYLAIIVLGLFGEAGVRDALIVSGDAAATASHIAASPMLWRSGIAGDLVMHIGDIPLIVILYLLLRPVSAPLAMTAALFDLVQTAELIAAKLFLLIPLFTTGDAKYLGALEPQQWQALSYLAIRLDAFGFGFGLIFFGCGCLVTGYLIRKSGYFPWLIGALMQLAGLCYLINSFALILAPDFARAIFPAILAPSFIGESALCLWLLVKGVDVAKWNDRSRAGVAGVQPAF